MYKLILLIILSSFIFSGCKQKSNTKSVKPAEKVEKESLKVIKRNVNIVKELPHEGDKTYTQGFEIYNDILYESTGLLRESALKKIDLQTGEVLKQVDVEGIFAEGITIMNNQIILLSYRRGIALRYDVETLDELGIGFTYKTEGWGLTNDGTHLIMSDGSDKLYFRDPITYELVRTMKVTFNNIPLYYLNELEYANGKIYANVFGKEYIVSIDPKSGKVVEDISAANISCSQLSAKDPEAVLNGIAFNNEAGTFYVTGKKCPKIYEVKFQ